ncbi:glyoxalase/bleomycin resistance/dioxygenase family protein [Streptomyces sp. SID8379]|uniref:VOC family protein n=1 Tax=unclassified Streptomyces TaxID=2593676 RepID=UPI0003775EB2|nr:VOC family protein [Streptomyces sp. HmicA12]MYW63260.1 glyoxalase/bleomycin resistance/dioxygenase family protein [Streptomyces sp. SID8379]
MIRWSYAFIDRPYGKFGAACDFWARVTGSRLSELRGERGEFATLLPYEDGADACLKVQGVADGAGGAHIDLCVDDVPGEAARAAALGAQPVYAEPGLEVLRSPAGHPFCLVAWDGESVVPGPVEPSNRLDQICLDTAPGAYEAEVDFWAALTGWPEVPCGGAEFRRLAASPVQLLFQRLDSNDTASAHLDIACADADAVRLRHESLGAVFVREGTDWLVMRDPSGGVYCLTRRTP